MGIVLLARLAEQFPGAVADGRLGNNRVPQNRVSRQSNTSEEAQMDAALHVLAALIHLTAAILDALWRR